MTIKPILFNTDMVRAARNEQKTTTRRVMKPQPVEDELRVCHWKDCHWMEGGSGFPSSGIEDYAPYHVGDILYVPEAWKCRFAMLYQDGLGYEVVFRDGKIVRFRFDDKKRAKKWAKYARKDDNHWQSPYFMPREAARIFLRVTGVRVERLQDTFFEQGSTIFALRSEGVDIGNQCQECIDSYRGPCCIDYESECGVLDDVRDEFACVWDSTIKPADRAAYGWAANPWVWVIEFERCEKPDERGH